MAEEGGNGKVTGQRDPAEAEGVTGATDETTTPALDVPPPEAQRKRREKILELWEYDDGSVGFEHLNRGRKFQNAMFLERVFEVEAMKIRQHIAVMAAREMAAAVAKGAFRKVEAKGGKIELHTSLPADLLKGRE